MNQFTPTFTAATPNAAAPVIAVASPSAGPDDTITVTGTAIGDPSTQYLVYGQTGASDATTDYATTQVATADGATVTIAASEPANSMYLVWAVNASGASAPVAINQTQAWWIGAAGQQVQTTSGQTTVSMTSGTTMSVYGTNMSNGAATPQSWVYLQPTDGSPGQWATVSAANPYKVDFTASTPGTYQVWVNNGLGGAYGWSQVTQNDQPMLLTVTAAPPAITNWSTAPSAIINVMNYGATGGGTTDDGHAILKAIAALQPGDTLYFPAGTYLISGGEQLLLPQDTQVLGAGSGQTTLLFEGAVAYNDGFGRFEMGWLSPNNVEIDGLTLNYAGGQTTDSTLLAANYYPGFDITLNDVSLIANGIRPLNIQGANNVSIDNSVIQGLDVAALGTTNLFINQTTFEEAGGGQCGITNYGTSYDWSITNCTVQDYNDSVADGSATAGFLENNSRNGNIYNQYIANNRTVNLQMQTPGNFGAQIDYESAGSGANTIVASATADSVTFLTSNPSAYVSGDDVIITDGAGLGQKRYVTGVIDNYSSAGTLLSQTLALDVPWNVAPDSSSHAFVGYTCSNVAIYDNTFSDASGPDGSGGNLFYGKALEIFCGAYGIIFDGNTTYNLNQPVLMTSDGVTANNPAYFNQVINNQFNDPQYQGVGIGMAMPTDSTDPNFVGVVVRNNTITDAVIGIDLAWQGWGSDTLLTVEHNLISATQYAIEVFNDPLSLIYSNTFSAAGASAIGSQAAASGDTADLVSNSFIGYPPGDVSVPS
jgi:hypothetical protein